MKIVSRSFYIICPLIIKYIAFIDIIVNVYKYEYNDMGIIA